MRQRMTILMRRIINRLHQILFEAPTELLELNFVIVFLVFGTVPLVNGYSIYRFTLFTLVAKIMTPYELSIIFYAIGAFAGWILLFGDVFQRGISSLVICFSLTWFAWLVGSSDKSNFLFPLLMVMSAGSFFLARRRQVELVAFKAIEFHAEELRAKPTLEVEEIISLRLLENTIERKRTA